MRERRDTAVDFVTVTVAWSVVAAGWPAFGAVDRLRRKAGWRGVGVLVATAEYGGMRVTFRRAV